MEIKDLKERLLMPEVLANYQVEIQKNNRICCPFHDDKNPSMQYFPKTQTVQCFSSNCQHSGRPLDVINFIELKEGCTTHEAIMKGKRMLGEAVVSERPIDKVWRGLKDGLKKSSKAQAYLKGRCLSGKDVGYYSGKWGRSKLAKEAREVGLIKADGKTWGFNCLIFPLRNAAGRIVSFYGRSLSEGHYYQVGRSGLYPGSPSRKAKKVILTESVIDATTLLELPKIKAEYEVLALYGTQGLTKEHELALKACKELEEVIILLDGDEAGRIASTEHQQKLSKLLPKVKIRVVALPEGLDVNEVWVNHLNEAIFVDLIQEVIVGPSKYLNTEDPKNIRYQGEHAEYYIKGLKLDHGLESMKVTLITSVPHPKSPMKARGKVELYEDSAVEKYCARASKKVGVNADLLEVEINLLVEELEKYRASRPNKSKADKQASMSKLSTKEYKTATAFLKGPELFHRLNKLIGESGIVGEEKTRLLLLLVASSYKNSNTLHALIQGSSGSGKTLLMRKIMEMIPEQDRHIWTQVSAKSLYHAGQELKHTAIGIEDWDGLEDGAQYVLRELQSGARLSRTITDKRDDGSFYRKELLAEGPISSLMCTTHGEIYEDNMNRCLLVAVDESEEQTNRILEYQYRKDRGELDKATEAAKTKELEHLVSVLKPLKVVNPYAGQLTLPKEVHKIRRLNNLFQSFVKQVTWWHQYQRERDEEGRLITKKEDLRIAIDLLFETIVLKVDELDGSLRRFYEQLKAYIELKGKDHEFSRLEVRKALGKSKSQVERYIRQLLELEYIHQTGGHINKGYRYRVEYWDDNKRLRGELKESMNNQLDKL